MGIDSTSLSLIYLVRDQTNMLKALAAEETQVLISPSRKKDIYYSSV